MDAETWNEKVRAMNAARWLAARMAALHADLVRLAIEADELGMSSVAEGLQESVREIFRLAALAQQCAADLAAELEAAREAGEEPA